MLWESGIPSSLPTSTQSFDNITNFHNISVLRVKHTHTYDTCHIPFKCKSQKLLKQIFWALPFQLIRGVTSIVSAEKNVFWKWPNGNKSTFLPYMLTFETGQLCNTQKYTRIVFSIWNISGGNIEWCCLCILSATKTGKKVEFDLKATYLSTVQDSASICRFRNWLDGVFIKEQVYALCWALGLQKTQMWSKHTFIIKTALLRLAISTLLSAWNDSFHNANM